MKKSVEIPVHIIFWTMFTVLTFVLSKMYLESVPDAPFAAHFTYVVLLELVMGLVFFYTTFFMMPWAQKNKITLLPLLQSSLCCLSYLPCRQFKLVFWKF